MSDAQSEDRLADLRAKIINRVRQLGQIFPSLAVFANDKHDFSADFGLPVHVTDDQLRRAYERFGLGRSAVNKTVRRTWSERGTLLETPADDDETVKEAEAKKELKRLRLWQRCQEADRRSLINGWSGLILILKDGKCLKDPVSMKSGGWAKLSKIIPAWAGENGQLRVSEWDEDEGSDTFGDPKMFQFTETRTGTKPGRAVNVHPDRVIVWSGDGTPDAPSTLLAGYNELMTAFKVVGSGGEGFWKNAKSTPHFNLDKDASVEDMAMMLGVEPKGIADAFGKQMDAINKGFDPSLLTKGIDSKVHQINLPSPEHYFLAAVQCFAAAFEMPVKILLGAQTGERASTEDASEWSVTCQARRDDVVEPALDALISRLRRFGILSSMEWSVHWPEITDAGPDAKLARAKVMADVNTAMSATGELIFTGDEMREETGRQPLSPAEASFKEEDLPSEEEAEITELKDVA